MVLLVREARSLRTGDIDDICSSYIMVTNQKGPFPALILLKEIKSENSLAWQFNSQDCLDLIMTPSNETSAIAFKVGKEK